MDALAAAEISMTPEARQALLDHLGKAAPGTFVRIDVGRGWGGTTYHLSLDETAEAERDEVIEAGGIRFVVEAHRRPLVGGLRIEIQRFFGREGLVAYGTSGGGAC